MAAISRHCLGARRAVLSGWCPHVADMAATSQYFPGALWVVLHGMISAVPSWPRILDGVSMGGAPCLVPFDGLLVEFSRSRHSALGGLWTAR
eukprot:7353070-Pyramimonas_sp.AAC.1